MFSCPYLDKQTKLSCEIYPNLWYMRILHLAPKFEDFFLYNLGFLDKILIFENDRKIRNINILFGKIFSHMYSLIPWNTYSMVYITWNLVPEAEFDKNMTRLFKQKSLYSCPCQWDQIFFKLSLHNTHGQLKGSCHYQIYDLLAWRVQMDEHTC